MTVEWLTGDALHQVRALPDDSVDLIASSPPFLALRNYADLEGQWGSEPTPAAFLDNLLTLATELRRVLTPWGSLAFELGDKMAGSGGAGGDYQVNGMRSGQPRFGKASGVGWPLSKSLCGLPTLFAWSLAYGRNLLNPEHAFEPWRIRNVIVWARNNPPVGCVDDQTEALTPDGWKRHDNLHDGELIAAYDPATDSCRFQSAKFVKWHRDGEPMVVIEKRKTSQRLTLDHRCLVRTRKRPDPFVVLAGDLTNDQQVMLAAPIDDIGGPEPVTAERAELLGWYITEGSVHHRQARIVQSLTANAQNVARIRELLERDGGDFSEYRYRRSSGKYGGHVLVTFNVKGELAEWLNLHHKRLPSQYATTWPTMTLRYLWAGLIGGDGHYRKGGGILFHQKARPVVDATQIVALRLGLRASVTYQPTLDVWQCTVGDSQHYESSRWTKVRKWDGPSIPRETYTGTVWCPMVETSFWLARRGGRTFVTGNSLGDKVRPATSYITVACPSDKRWFDLDAIRTEPIVNLPPAKGNNTKGSDKHSHRFGQRINSAPGGAPPTDHWTDEYDGDITWLINSGGSSLAHYAMWPAKLAERLVLSMCPAEVCRECGEPRRRITGPAEYVRPNGRPHIFQGDDMPSGTLEQGKRQRVTGHDTGKMTRVAPTLGWSDCNHGSYRVGRVLDCFSGSGTTLAVADLHGRDATGIDLDPANQDLYERRYGEVRRALFGVRPEVAGQEQLELL